ncbi:hypothetical protein [Streptomyces sp. NPDC048577]|uniref:hypothetical protein n=1 Tax=Streptomyces sp. NPDC048577 TaxID=3157209 RepID=UPI003426EB26
MHTNRRVAELLAEQARKAATEPENTDTGQQPEQPADDTKPPGYYANCPRDEFDARLRALGIHNHGHGLPRG